MPKKSTTQAKYQHINVPVPNTNKRIKKKVSVLPSSVSGDVVRGWRGKRKEKIIRLKKIIIHFCSKQDCTLLNCVLWHQNLLRGKILRELLKKD